MNIYDFIYAILAGVISNNISDISKSYLNMLAKLLNQFRFRIKFEVEIGLR